MKTGQRSCMTVSGYHTEQLALREIWVIWLHRSVTPDFGATRVRQGSFHLILFATRNGQNEE